MMTNKQIEAIYKLYPNVTRTLGDVAYDAEDNVVEYDLAAIQAEAATHQYKQQRALEYPSIGDQLDALFHAGVFPESMAAEIQAIKNKYPKS
jgi:hypothetical protein